MDLHTAFTQTHTTDPRLSDTMVQTRSARKTLAAGKDSDLPEIHIVADHDARPAKQSSKHVETRKTAAKTKETSRRSNMRGKLTSLLEMNLDVLSQILSYLCPMDLLNLARSSKAFRQFLMSKSHAFVWVAARKQVAGLPACPPDLSEPEYANLVFDSHCHHCGRVVHIIYWNIRRRYCPGCRAKHLRGLDRCKDLPDTRAMLPTERLRGIERHGLEHYVDRRQYDAVYKAYLQTPYAKRDEFVAQRREIVVNMQECGAACERWHEGLVAARERELEQAKNTRNELIFDRLRDAGYVAEIRYIGQREIMRSQADVFRTSKRLTEREWKEVFSKLEPNMIKFRERRLDGEVYYPRVKQLSALYDRYIQEPAPEGRAVDLLPSPWDVAHFAPFDAIIKLPEDVTVDEMTFRPAFDQLVTLTKRWRHEVDAQLASLFNISNDPSTPEASTRRQNQHATSAKEHLQLACAVFETQRRHIKGRGWHNSNIFGYPHILARSTVFYSYHYAYDRGARIYRPWSLPTDGSASVKLFTGATDVIRACGLDPRVATTEDMDRLNVRLTCNECRERSPERVEVLSWRGAIDHLHRQHKAGPMQTETWTLLDKNLVTMAEAEEQRYTHSLDDSNLQVQCALCQPHADMACYSSTKLATHLSIAHGINEIDGPLKENVHYHVCSRGLDDRRPLWMITKGEEVVFSYAS